MLTADTETLTLRELLRNMDYGIRLTMMKPMGPRRWNLYRFVWRFGRIHRAQPLPRGYRRMPPKQCFTNAQKLARKRGLIYVEGYASTGILPILHGWCIDPAHPRKVIDPTTSAFTEYVGVPFRPEVMQAFWKQAVELNHWSMLDDWEGGFPLLCKSAAEIKPLIWRPNPKENL